MTTKIKYALTFLTLISAAVSVEAKAAIVSGYGATAWTSTSANCPSYCSGPFASDSAGGEFISTATSVQNTYAVTQAYVSLSGSTYLPLLRAFSQADPLRGGDASAMGVQGYTYNGASSTTITLDLNLHGSVANGDPDYYRRNVLEGSAAVFIGSNLNFYGGFGTMVYENSLPAAGVKQLFLTSGTNASVSDSISFNIDPGQDFYVLGYMNASSKNGYADALNTLTMQFTDASGLTAVDVSAVPIPAAVWLLGSGLLGLLAVTRRKV